MTHRIVRVYETKDMPAELSNLVNFKLTEGEKLELSSYAAITIDEDAGRGNHAGLLIHGYFTMRGSSPQKPQLITLRSFDPIEPFSDDERRSAIYAVHQIRSHGVKTIDGYFIDGTVDFKGFFYYQKSRVEHGVRILGIDGMGLDKHLFESHGMFKELKAEHERLTQVYLSELMEQNMVRSDMTNFEELDRKLEGR